MRIKKLLCLEMAAVLLFSGILDQTLYAKEKRAYNDLYTATADDVPGLNARVNKKNILKLLDCYDEDGAYILRSAAKNGGDFLDWFSPGERIIDGIDTAVHEETHFYSHLMSGFWGKTAYFVGNKKHINVAHTKVFRTQKTASSIPKKLRTMRYSTYVAKPTKNLDSDVNGAYGLMNEFMAYRMGMSTTVSLYPYYVDQDADWDAWKVFINSCENGRLAYAEFKYYILHYLYYAKQHNRAVYRGITGNKKFCQAYGRLESNYAKLIREYEKDLTEFQQIMKDKGITIEIDDENVDNSEEGNGIGRFTGDYEKLQKELDKSKYQKIHKQLTK